LQDCDCAGGRFNRSAVVEFESSGEVLTISQTFTGQDVQGHMRISTHLDGHLPDIAEDAQVEVDDYYEEYRRISPGTSAADAVTSLVSLTAVVVQRSVSEVGNDSRVESTDRGRHKDKKLGFS